MDSNNKDDLFLDFLDGNERIEAAIEEYHRESKEENVIRVLEEIRKRMHEDGHFLFPVQKENADEQQMYGVRTIQTEDGKVWNVAFTSVEEFEKAPKSKLLSVFIDKTLQGCLDGETAGFLLNPWGKSFAISQNMIRLMFEVDKKAGRKLFTKEELADGALLKAAIRHFKENQTRENLVTVLQILRDSNVWIPCNTILGDEDYKALQEMINNAGEEDPKSLVGQTFFNRENIRLIPDILSNGGKFYFPVFSSAEEMGEYGERFSKIEKHLLEAIMLAKNNERKVEGIVVNAYSDPFVLTSEMFEAVEKLESSLES